jgi:glycosyltransferase involved in cell wall biosynthesis
MPKLLFLANRLPYPTHSGADIRTYNVWRELALRWDVDAIVMHNRAEDVDGLTLEDRRQALSELGRVDIVPLEAQLTRARTLAAHGKALLLGVPYLDYVFRGKVFADTLAQRLATSRYDVVHVDGISLMHNFAQRTPANIILTHHNIESDLLDRRAAFTPNALVSHYMRLQARRLRASEVYWAERVALNICVSAEDATRLREMAPRAQIVTIPNAVSDTGERPLVLERRQQRGLFVGGLNWFPNTDALAYYAQDIEPLFHTQGGGFPTTWVGKASPVQIAEYAGHRSIQVHGYAPELEPFMRSARVFIAPLRVGGGTRLKILDAWAAGVPVVATTLACEGLGAVSGHDLLIGDTPGEFVHGVRQLLTNDEQWHAVASQARSRLQAGFTWKALGAQLRAHYAGVVEQVGAGLS